MSERIETFDVEESPSFDLATNAGDIVVKEWDEPRVRIVLSGDTDLVDGATIDVTTDLITVHSRDTRKRLFGKRVHITVTTPGGGSVRARVGAGAVRIRAAMQEISIDSGAGDIRVDENVGDVKVRVGSGDVSLPEVAGDADIQSANGDVRVRSVDTVRVSTAAGDVRLENVERSARVKSASGDITIQRFAGNDLDVRTMSGDVRIGLIPNLEVKASIKTLSGDFRNRITPSPGDRIGSATLSVSSFSGDVTLNTARPDA
jgi:DUF4097 and DUF4098 domain-containing protein YvlB